MVIGTISDLGRQGVSIRSLTGLGIDTTTLMGESCEVRYTEGSPPGSSHRNQDVPKRMVDCFRLS